MANLLRAETDNPRVGGVVIIWPSGAQKVARWQLDAPIENTLLAAREYIETMIDERVRAGAIDDVERTNVASLVAATQALIHEWNERLRAHLIQARSLQ